MARTLCKLEVEGVELAVLGPSWPLGLSPRVEISEGLELPSEGVGVDAAGELMSEGVDAAAEVVVHVVVEDFEVGLRENFTLFLSPPHLEDPLLGFIFNISSSAVDLFLPGGSPVSLLRPGRPSKFSFPDHPLTLQNALIRSCDP